MKKSVIILSHIGFWLMIWFLFFTLMNLIPMLLPSGNYSPQTNWFAYKWATMAVGILSVPFYIFFFYTKLIIKNVRYLIYPLVLIIPYYIGHVIWGGNNTYKYMDALMSVCGYSYCLVF